MTSLALTGMPVPNVTLQRVGARAGVGTFGRGDAFPIRHHYPKAPRNHKIRGRQGCHSVEAISSGPQPWEKYPSAPPWNRKQTAREHGLPVPGWFNHE